MPPFSSNAEIHRTELLGLLDTLVEQAARDGKHAAVLIVSIEPKDRMITLTHPKLDAELSSALDKIQPILRPADRLAVLGNNQACLVLPELTNPVQPWLAAHKISKTLAKLLSDDAGEPWARVLVGFAAFPQHAKTARALFVRADESLNRARGEEDGIFSPGTDGMAAEEPYSRDAMLDILRANDFRVVFQPQFDLAAGRCESAEALLRANAGGEPMPPSVLAAFAEREGKIGQLTASLLNNTLRQARAWLDVGVAINVAVNLSPVSLRDHGFPALVGRALQSWEVPAHQLTLEIVESSMIDNFSQAAGILNELKGLGTKLSIDDFGTGYSCLAYLRQLPLDELKVDQSFVRNLERSREDRQLVQAIIDLAHNFELKAVAEGVENRAMWDSLAEMGCDFIQGYALSRPLEADQFLGWFIGNQPLVMTETV